MPLLGLRNKTAEVVEGAADKAKTIGSAAAGAASKGLQSAGQMAKQAQHDMKMAYYSPVFWEDYHSPDFDLPNMIVIVDEDERRGIDVCEGAIGWRSKEAGVEVLHLYQKAVPESNLTFFPAVNCYAAYYLDMVGRDRFIDLSSYYEVIQKDKMTELRNVAHALGARECRLESFEVEKAIEWKKGKGRVKAQPANEKIDSVQVAADVALNQSTGRERSVIFAQKFEGSNEPVRPHLHWYKNDMELQSLIEMRCGDGVDNAIKEYSITLDCSSSATMAVKMAAKIDAALKKLGAACNFSLEGESHQESRKRLVFSIVF